MKLRKKTKNFPLALEKNVTISDNITTYKNENKPNTHTQNKKLLCDWTDKKK